MLEELQQRLEQQGYVGQVLSSEHAADLQEEIEAHHRAGHLDAELYQEYLESFDFQPPEKLGQARSIIALTVPDPPRQITFNWHGQPVAVVVPPTYLHWRAVDKRVEDTVAEILAPAGYHAALAKLPKKLTAVRSGLAAYGRNNITYVPGMGSFHRLVVLWSDLPWEEDNWYDLQMMETCQKCQGCQRACPTAAIDPDRFPLHAERCLTFHNEKPPEVPFPDWVDPSWHNCLVGCMRCQSACPENKEVRDRVVGDDAFSEEETRLVLDGVPQEHLLPETVARLERLDLPELLDILPRNLRALLDAEA